MISRSVPTTPSTSVLSRFNCDVTKKLSIRSFSSSVLRINAERSNDHSSLTWNEFLKYRTYRRGFQVASMGISGLVGLVVGWEYISSVNIDPTQMIFGFDPLLAMGAGLFVFTGFCALLGPLLGNFFFNLLALRSKRVPFRLKEDLFLQHVKKNRVDPSYQSFANPVPDYYGEKITSLHGYRRWLRNCAAYRKKRDEFLKT
ncbi:mitochondrial import protein Pam17 [Lipomyces doorenjongii]|uniref:mitochondrial import protein Pam17 n=1 Tax=Lipomyces doorenjongii TaxID=383834 RepID=UPI0033437AF8